MKGDQPHNDGSREKKKILPRLLVMLASSPPLGEPGLLVTLRSEN